MRGHPSDFSLNRKIVALRLFRLGHLPPALYETEMLAEEELPVLVLEYGNQKENEKFVSGLFKRVRWESPWAKHVPARALALYIFATTLFKLIGKVLSNERPALIIAHGIQETAMAYVLYLVTRVPFVVHVHEVYDMSELSLMNRFFMFLEKPALRKAQFLIFPEKNRAELYRTRYGLKQTLYLTFNCPRRRSYRNGREYRDQLHLDQNTKLLVYLGGIGPVNALLEAIEAVSNIPNLAFLIAGWGSPIYFSKLRKLVEQKKLAARIFLPGAVQPEEKWKILDAADLSYCVYHPKNLRLKYGATASNKLMEAFAAGVPVLTSSETDFRSIVETYDVGICTESIDSAGIERGLRALLEDEVGWKRRRENALKLHQQAFNFEAQFAEPLKAFEKWAMKVRAAA